MDVRTLLVPTAGNSVSPNVGFWRKADIRSGGLGRAYLAGTLGQNWHSQTGARRLLD